jgi:hypothetical protein
MEETKVNYSIENLKQVLDAFFDLLIVLIPKFHDGVQAQDFLEIAAKITSDQELQTKIVKAYNDVELVPKEVGDLQVSEILELISFIVAKAPALLAALRK